MYNEIRRGHCLHQSARQHVWCTPGAATVRPVKVHTAGIHSHNRIKTNQPLRGGPCGPSAASPVNRDVYCCVVFV